MAITYTATPSAITNTISVKQDGKHVGKIKGIPGKGFAYFPKGALSGGAWFPTLAECKARLVPPITTVLPAYAQPNPAKDTPAPTGVMVPLSIDWVKLRAQKAWLMTQPGQEADGLLAIIDAIQDWAVDEAEVPEEEVFGKSPD